MNEKQLNDLGMDKIHWLLQKGFSIVGYMWLRISQASYSCNVACLATEYC